MTNSERLMTALAPVFAEGERDVNPQLLAEIVDSLDSLADDELTGAMTADSSFTTEFVDRDGLLAVWADWLDAFVRVRLEMEAVEEIGENVLILVNQTGTTRHGVDLSQPSAGVWKFRDGSLARVEFHLDREKARESARRPA